MLRKLLFSGLALIGLLLAGPQKANAQTVFACVTSIGNISIVAANANCLPGATKITLSQTPGPIAAREYSCGTPVQSVLPGAAVNFDDTGIGFGTTLPTGTTPFASFLLQPGTYQAHLSISIVESAALPPIFQSFTLGFPFSVWLIQNGAILSGDRLFSVTTPNTTVALELSGGTTPVIINGTGPFFPCLLIITQLH
jgi:hypothetical protein